MSKRFLLSLLLVIGILLPTLAFGEETAAQDTVACLQARILGPLPQSPALEETTGILRGTAQIIPEITVKGDLPGPDDEGWRDITAGAEGRFQLTQPGVYWVAARLRTTRYGEASVILDHGSALYSQGEKLSAQAPGETADPLSATTTLTRGWVMVKGRVILTDEDLSFAWQAAADSTAIPTWTLSDKIALTRFSETNQVASLGSLAVADSGKLVARFRTRRSDHTNRLDFLNSKGQLVASDVGGGKMRPVGFLPGGAQLLLRRGKDLVLWNAPTGDSRTILKDEPGLGFLKLSPDGRTLLFASTKGFKTDDPVDGPGHHYMHFRERVSDYTPAPHLHLMDLATGVRRVLTQPGDYVVDDASFSPDGKTVIYGRTLPQSLRPWFTSEIRRIELDTGSDELITAFTSGWEVRPQAFAVSPDGKRLAFIGPPAEISAHRQDADQHNVYNTQVWLLDLSNGQYERVTQDESFAFEGGGGFPVFRRNGELLVKVVDGSTHRVARLTADQGRWSAKVLPMQRLTMGAVALSPNHKFMVYTASDPARPADLYLTAMGKSGHLLEKANPELNNRILWAQAQDMSFTGPGGEIIDAWYFPPLAMVGDQATYTEPAAGKAPLIVYYYGGSVATLRSFNTTFQFFAAGGYGVLAVNPRGAAGFGEDFADYHAGDWGPAAAADIMAATEHVLAVHPYLDRAAMGIYGGSYGGFMTDYLVTHTDMYSAAVSMYGISDLMTYFGQGAWGVTYGDMALGGRNPWDDPRYFIEHSPVFQADQVKTPLLLLHGLVDTNVTTGQSIQLFTELSVLDKPVEMVLFPQENHGISGTWKNRAAHRTMLLEWFDRWLKNQPEAWEDRWQ